MNDEIRKLGRTIEDIICPKCRRIDLPCKECPVQKLADMCRQDELVTRTLISKQQFEYLCDVGVITSHSCSHDLVKYPDGMTHIALLHGEMIEDLIKDTPWSIEVNVDTHISPDTRTGWCIPDWLFIENQKEVLMACFGSAK